MTETECTNAIAPAIPSSSAPTNAFDWLLRAHGRLFQFLNRTSSRVESLAREMREASGQLETQIHEMIESGRDKAVASAQLASNLPRASRVVESAVRIAADYRLVEIKSVILSAEGRHAEMQAAHRRNAQRLQRLCMELGGGVLKLGQFLSCRMDLLPTAYVEALSGLQDRVPASPANAVKALIESELGRPMKAVFQHFNPKPMAAASLAQVHSATLLDGTPVAVKVQRPGVEEIIHADLLALRIAARVLAGTLPQFDLRAIASELDRSVSDELDFRREAENATHLAALFRDDARIALPRLHPDGITTRLLIMEHVVGDRLTGYLDRCRNEGEAGARRMADLMETLLDSFAAQILRHGFYQADPHPGNFLVTPEGRLVFLDMGNVGRIAPAARRAYARLVTAFLSGDVDATAQCLEELGFRAAGDDRNFLLRYAEAFMEGFRFEPGGAWKPHDIETQLETMLQLSRARMSVKVPEDFILLARVLISLTGLMMHYRPPLKLAAILMPHLVHALREE